MKYHLFVLDNKNRILLAQFEADLPYQALGVGHWVAFPERKISALHIDAVLHHALTYCCVTTIFCSASQSGKYLNGDDENTLPWPWQVIEDIVPWPWRKD